MDGTRNRGTSRVGHHVLVGAFAAAAAIGATSAVAATDIFAKIGDIKGESSDDKHPGEIEVLAWSWGVNGADSGRKKNPDNVPACGEPLSIDKLVDKASPLLVTGAVAQSRHFPRPSLPCARRARKPLEFLGRQPRGCHGEGIGQRWSRPLGRHEGARDARLHIRDVQLYAAETRRHRGRCNIRHRSGQLSVNQAPRGLAGARALRKAARTSTHRRARWRAFAPSRTRSSSSSGHGTYRVRRKPG